MIYGQGAIRAVLLYPDGSTYATLDLTRPTRRETQDWEEIYYNYGTDADGQAVTELVGVRFHGVYVWTSHGDNQTAMADVLKLANWKGGDKAVRVYPHYSDAPQIAIRCAIQSAKLTPLNGKVTGEEFRIELWGTDLLEAKPNAATAGGHARRAHANV